MTMNSGSCPSFENFLISPFQKDIFAEYTNLEQQFFPFSSWKKCAPVHWCLCLVMRTPIIDHFPFWGPTSALLPRVLLFPLLHFLSPNFCLLGSEFDVDDSWHGFLGVNSAQGLFNFWKRRMDLQVLDLWMPFHPHLLLCLVHSFSAIGVALGWIFCYVAIVPLGSVYFPFPSVCSLLLRRCVLYCIFNFINFPMSFILLNPCSGHFILIVIIFSLRFSFDSSVFAVSFLRLSNFHLFEAYTLKHFRMTSLKCLAGNRKILIQHLGYFSVDICWFSFLIESIFLGSWCGMWSVGFWAIGVLWRSPV